MNFVKNTWPALFWALVIFILSSLSPARLHLPSFWDLFSLDKAAHATCYAILVFLLIVGFQKQTEIKFAFLHFRRAALVSAIIYGGLIELYQAFVLTDRNGDWFDFIANTVGCLIGGQFFVKWNSRKKVSSN